MRVLNITSENYGKMQEAIAEQVTERGDGQ